MAGTTALAVVDQINLPALDKELLASMQEEMEGMSFTFDRIKIPSGGGVAYEVPGDDPENPDMEKEVYGVILDHHPINAWWAKKYSGEKNPPDCSSIDGQVGVPRVTEDEPNPQPIACANCPRNQWGSAPADENGNPSNGKACKNMRRIYFTRPDCLFPLLLVLPPTSLQNFQDYIKRSIIGKKCRSYEILTKMTLTKDKSSGGITYSKAVFAPAGILDKTIKEQTAAYAKEIKAFTRTIEVGAEDYNVESSGTTADSEEDPF